MEERDQDLEFVVVLDFEAVCVEDHLPKPKPQEIIEFPAIIFDLTQQMTIDVFHYYIKPQVHSKLSNFCINLTGISQNQVDNGISLQDALERHNEWLIINGLVEKVTNKKLKRWAYLTCGEWDLFTCLPENCVYHKYNIPDYFNHYINLIPLFEKFYNTKARGMVTMLQLLSIPLIGHHHSGIDDCHNILSIVKNMVSRGYKFKSYQERLVDPRFIREDDWICTNCITHNFFLSLPCRQCGRPITTTSIRGLKNTAKTTRPGDWTCPNCSCLNFCYRVHCYSCSKPKPENLPTTNAYADWNCVNCGYVNFSYRMKCKQCFSDKSS